MSAMERLLLELPERTILRMFSFLSPADVVTLAKSSRYLRSIAQFYMSHAWDFHTFFSSWFPGRTECFRDLLDHTGAVVSGSQALQFFDRVQYPDSDLDIFVRAGGFYPLVTFLAGEGYASFLPKAPTGQQYGGPAFVSPSRLAKTCIKNMQTVRRPIIAVYNFKGGPSRGFARAVDNDKIIQVIIVDSDPVHHIIYDFHSSEYGTSS